MPYINMTHRGAETNRTHDKTDGGSGLRKFLFRLIAMLVVLGAIGFVGFAYVGDLTPDRSETRETVTLPLNN